ncbi:ADP-ribose 1''-phosphate phosphatase [Toensbergia leucococca]|nr:ADP-ribose 1''-phosphate phosphatase [Toensbergia leucococca]
MSRITSSEASIFSAPSHSILIHACNTKGVWGSGVALEFKNRYPAAYASYRTHCLNPPPGISLAKHQASLVGTALLIAPLPFPTNTNNLTESDSKSAIPTSSTHHIACLYTSLSYGRSRSPPETILQNTQAAMADLETQIAGLRSRTGEKQKVGEVWAVRINSGRFGVEWDRTKEVLEEGGLDLVVVSGLGVEAAEAEGEMGMKDKV